MKTFLRWSLMVVCLFALSHGTRAQERAGGALQAPLVYAEMNRDYSQATLGNFAAGPVTGLILGAEAHRFMLVGQFLRVEPEAVERAAPHLDRIAAILPADSDQSVAILTFDDAQWATALVEGAEEDAGATATRRDAPRMKAVGPHVVLGMGETDLSNVDMDGLAEFLRRRSLAQARQTAGDAPVWAWLDVPALLELAREEEALSPEDLEMLAKLVGIECVRDAVVTGRWIMEEGTSVMEATVNLKDEVYGLPGMLGQGPNPLLDRIPAEAGAFVALHWGDPQDAFDSLTEAGRRYDAVVDPDADMDEELAELEAELGMTLEELAAQLGRGVVAYADPGWPHGMITRADAAAVLDLDQPEAWVKTMERWVSETEGYPMVLDLDGQEIGGIPEVPLFYTVAQSSMVVAHTASGARARVDWMQGDDRRSVSDAPPGAISLRIRVADILQGYPMKKPRRQQRLADAPVPDEPVDPEEALGVWSFGMMGGMLGDADIAASVVREGNLMRATFKLENVKPRRGYSAALVLYLSVWTALVAAMG